MTIVLDQEYQPHCGTYDVMRTVYIRGVQEGVATR